MSNSDTDNLLNANVREAIARTISAEVETKTKTLSDQLADSKAREDALHRENKRLEAELVFLNPLEPLVKAGITPDRLRRAALCVAVIQNPNDVAKAADYLRKTGWDEDMGRNWVDPVSKGKHSFSGALPAQLRRDTAIFDSL